MLKWFRSMGHTFQAIFSIGFAVLWGSMAWYFHGMGEFGPGMPTVIGTGALAVMAGLTGLINLLRAGFTATAPAAHARDSGGWDENQPSDFDTDAIIARHLANRKASTAAAPSTDPLTEGRQAPRAPAFGRKVAP
jgi:hypothetical protein